MLKTLAPAFVAVLIAGMFVACAGGGADPTPTQETALAQPATSTATTSEPTATATVPAATATATEPASPTPAPTRTPGAAPTRLIPTATPTPTPTPTATPEQGDEVAQLLGFAALTADDLGGDWTLDSTEVPDLVGDESTAICGQPRFVDRATRTGRLQLDFSSDLLPAALIQDLVAFPYTTTVEAMNYARDSVGACAEWTDEEGAYFQINPLEDPVLGDESFAFTIAFDAPDGTPIETYSIVVREDEYLLTLTYITFAGGDISPLLGIAQTATAKMFGISEWFFYDHLDPSFLAQSGAHLLTTLEILGGWTLDEYAIPSAEDRYGFCNADAFPDVFVARSEIAARYHIDPDNGPFLTHTIVALENAEAATVAMSFIRETTACAEWNDDIGDYYRVADRPDSALGDEAIAVIAQNEAVNFGTVQIEFMFVRTGSLITVILLAQLGQIDHAQVEDIARVALAKLGR